MRNYKNTIHPEEIVTGTAIEATGYLKSTLHHQFVEFADDPTAIFIYSGAIAGPSGIILHNIREDILRKYLVSITKQDTKLLFDDTHEGLFFYEIVPKLHNVIKETDIRPDQIHYFSSTLNINEIYKKYCVENNVTEYINVYSSFIFEHLVQRCGIKDRFNVIKKKKKLFLCFNRIFRQHRYALLGLLLEKNLVDQAYYSFFMIQYGDKFVDIDTTYDMLDNLLTEKTRNIIYKEIKSNKHLIPFKLNIEGNNNKNYLDSDDMPYYDESYFSLVTETGFFKYNWVQQENTIFFSEKIFKPVVARHPFILVSAPHSLKYLRKLGYKTFSPYINEEYDDIENDDDRLVAIVAEVERLSKYTDEQWLNWQESVDSILTHNHKIIRTRKLDEYVFSRPDIKS